MSGAGDDTFNFEGNVGGSLNAGEGFNVYRFLAGSSPINAGVLISGNDTWHHINGQTLTTGAVTGTGTLTVPNEAGAPTALTVGTDATRDLFLPNLIGFDGGLIIGGIMTPPTLPLNGGTTVTVNTSDLTVLDTIQTNGDISLFGFSLFLDVENGNSIDAGPTGTIFLLATGSDPANGGTGLITTNKVATSITGRSGIFIATGGIQDAFKITLNLNPQDGSLQTAVGDGVPPAFATGSTFRDVALTNGSDDSNDNTEAFLGAAGAVQIPAAPNNIILTLGTFAREQRATQAILASNLIGLQQIGFIDTSLFEEELSLYGVIGRGIALALAQCEELEGCAPNVTEEELEQLIAALEARIAELEQRLAETENEADRRTLEELITGYRQELENFLGYREQLEEYTSGGLDDELEDDLDEDSSGEELAPDAAESIAGEVERLTSILEVARERINWLESLKANPEERARLGETTGIDLSIEALDEIIDATRRETESLESQIRLLLEGTEARHAPASLPQFWAEAGDVLTITQVQYGSSLLQDGDTVLAANELWY